MLSGWLTDEQVLQHYTGNAAKADQAMAEARAAGSFLAE